MRSPKNMTDNELSAAHRIIHQRVRGSVGQVNHADELRRLKAVHKEYDRRGFRRIEG